MIYVAEDDQAIRDLILYTLNASGFQARGFQDGVSLLEGMKSEDDLPDLILLDIMLPEEDGLSILKKLRSDPVMEKVPVILETAKCTEFDTVKGLDLGADDYLCKPFGMMEMISRIRAVLRRTSKNQDDSILVCGPIQLNRKEHTVSVYGRPVVLTRKEYDLLKLLMNNHRFVFTREELLMKIWDTDFAGESRTVDVHINTLRSKLQEAGEAIQTVRGVGYRLDARILEERERDSAIFEGEEEKEEKPKPKKKNPKSRKADKEDKAK